MTGLSSYARVQEGAYVNPQNSLLTYVVQAEPVWVNFSVSENDVLKYRGQAEQGQLTPESGAYVVEVVLGDGSIFPRQGPHNFCRCRVQPANRDVSRPGDPPQPRGRAAAGSVRRVRLHGAMRPNAIVVPQRAVQQGAKGHFIWVVKEGKAEPRPVTVGDWLGNDWFITSGLQAGDRAVRGRRPIALRPRRARTA